MLTRSKNLKPIVTAAFCMLLGACNTVGSLPGMGGVFGDEGYFRDRQGDYLQAQSIPRLRIPETMDAYIIDDLLVIPDVVTDDGQAFLQPPRPRPLQGDPDRAVVIQRLGERSWVVVDASASQVWPRVRQYWQEKGIDLVQENPGTGQMDTAWFQNDDNGQTQEKIRVFVRPGFQDDSSEISLVHLSVPQDRQVFDQVNWPEQSMDPEYAYEILTDISTYLADQVRLYQASTVSFLAGNIPDEGRATLRTDGGADVLHLDADYQRSWVAIGRALERAGIEIIEEDMDAGYYQVAYSGQEQAEDEAGFFSRILSRNQAQSTPFRVSVMQTGDGIEVRSEPIMPDGSEGNADVGGQASPEQEQASPENALLATIYEFIT